MGIALIVMKESNLSVNNKRGKKAPSLPPPEEICVKEDDTYEGSSKVLPNLTKFKRVDGSMPSFKVLDEESEEDEVAAKVQNDEYKIVTQQTVFDHIREKAKNFPVLVASNSVFPPS
ncbi:hypothetical protein M0R45_009279 [Rubus argutus]|uniref:Uncharacterized protein n=1 Tax=Rubus argutus TaxID=59490 RepID=A0AAW1Y712_RUBAR